MSQLPLAKAGNEGTSKEKARTRSSSSATEVSQGDAGTRRGRKQEREGSGDAGKEDEAMSGDDQDNSGTTGNGERKRKRSRKGLDKKYKCLQDGCGKSYSRAEHLYRHQLNRKLFPTTASGQSINALINRYTQADIQMRLSGLSTIFRPARSLHATSGASHHAWISSPKEGQLSGQC